jgi:hypothetical protein
VEIVATIVADAHPAMLARPAAGPSSPSVSRVSDHGPLEFPGWENGYW